MRSIFRSLGILLVFTALVAFFATVSFADDKAEAIRRVAGRVPPSIGVGALATQFTDFPQPIRGDVVRFRVVVPFRIDANSQTVQITICISNFYKGDDPKSLHFITVDKGTQVRVTPASGNETGDGNNRLPISGTCTISALGKSFPGLQTDPGKFESGQRGAFSQDVIVEPTWIRDAVSPTDAERELELPVGEYSGFVRLNARIDP